jgi:DNA-directed RNA polymerase subunit L
MSTTPKIIVSDITITDLSPKVKKPHLEKYMPKTLFPKHIEFQIAGVTNAESNAIRRTVACELLVSGMHVEYEDISTNDMFILPEMLINRLRLIPIDQSTPLDAVFGLTVTNTTDQLRDVKAGEMRIVSGGKGSSTHPQLKKLPFNETYTLFTLNAGKSIEIKNIGIHQDYGFNEEHGGHVVAVNAASVAIDQKAINTYEPNDGDGIPSRISNPRVWRLRFTTNGTMEPKKIVASACDNIISRVQAVQNLLYSIQNNGDEYILTIDGETDTIGNLFMKTICEIYPDIRAITYSTSSVGRVLTVRIRCDEDINTIYSTTIKHIVKVFTEIKKYFE